MESLFNRTYEEIFRGVVVEHHYAKVNVANSTQEISQGHAHKQRTCLILKLYRQIFWHI